MRPPIAAASRARRSSIAVMGTGRRPHLSAAQSRARAASWRRDGCLISEFPLGTPPLPGNFPRRNRLISGLSRGVLVVEAAQQSGSLITARCAVEQDRDVFAIPGSIHSPLSKGCHGLIKEGAKLVECADDVLVELGMAPRTASARRRRRRRRETRSAARRDGLRPGRPSTRSPQRTGLGAAALAAPALAAARSRAASHALPGGRFQRVENRVIE